MSGSIQTLASVAWRRPAMASALDRIWESGDAPFQDGVDSLTSLRRIGSPGRLSLENGIIVTSEDDSDGSDSTPDVVEEGEGYLQDSDDYEIPTHGVPTEVTLCENDNDDSHHDSDSESELDADESEEESENEEESEEEGDGVIDDDEPAADYETEDDSVESNCSGRGTDEDEEYLMDDESCRSVQSEDSASSDTSRQHELFLPRNISPSTQSLKYEEDSDESSDEDHDDVSCIHHRTSMIGRSGRPRMCDGCPASISVSSNSSLSEDGSRHSKKRKRASMRGGVSFSDSVTVYPVFHCKAYPPSVVKSIYTKREELRVNKIRSRKEFAYDMYDWRNATEEDDMEPNEEGELVHPVHCTEKATVKTSPPSSPYRTTRKIVQTYSSALGGYQTSKTVHRTKRMRMFYP